MIHDVLIVGAGLAGLTAADMLMSKGLSVQVLEAREDVGGRLRTLRADEGVFVELGAQWISRYHRHMGELARRFDVDFHPTYRKGRPFYADQRQNEPATLLSRLNNSVAMVQAGLFLRGLVKLCRRAAEEDLQRLDTVLAGDFIRESRLSVSARQLLLDQMEAGFCVEPGKISILELARQMESVGGPFKLANAEEFIFTNGGQKIVHGLAGRIERALRTGSAVNSIDDHGDSLAVTSADGTYAARHVILAVPPQIIASLSITPPLAKDRCQVLEKFVNGSVVKTTAVYETPFWRQQGYSGIVHAQGADFPEIADSGPAGRGPGLLTCLSTGRAAIRLAAQSGEVRCKQYKEFLITLFGEEARHPLRVVSVDWSAEPYAQGGYASRRGPLGWTDAPDLFAPHGRLHFAGTETADEWRSYMEGAVQSGQRAAQEVIDAL